MSTVGELFAHCDRNAHILRKHRPAVWRRGTEITQSPALGTVRLIAQKMLYVACQPGGKD